MNRENQEKSVSDTTPIQYEGKGPDKPGFTIIEGKNEPVKELSSSEQIAAMINKDKELIAKAKREDLNMKLQKVDGLDLEIQKSKEIVGNAENTGTISEGIKKQVNALIESMVAERTDLLNEDALKLHIINVLKKEIKKAMTMEDLRKVVQKTKDYDLLSISDSPNHRNGEFIVTKTDNQEVDNKANGLKDSILNKLNILRLGELEELIEIANNADKEKHIGLKSLDKCIEIGIKEGFLKTEQFGSGDYKIMSTQCITSNDDNNPVKQDLKHLRNTIIGKFRSYAPKKGTSKSEEK